MGGRLEGRVAIITGATSGIGAASAERFVKEGARVVLTGRSEEKGKAIAARLGKNAVYCRTDVTEDADLAAMVECAKKNFGRLDILFHNAGFATSGMGVEDITEDKFVYDMKLLLGSVLLGTKHALPLLRANGGSIINNASIAGMRSGFGPLVYSAAKAAVIQATVCMSMELAPHRIRVNAISPGVILTPIFGRVLGLDDEGAEKTLGAMGDALKKATQAERIGLPDDIAQAAVFLASDESSYVTGQNLVVDGGVIAGRSAQEFAQALQTLAGAVQAS
jgi:NAD(P)-dependent dehydrogenase (short-subunit alcohol dehydrogenase family)